MNRTKPHVEANGRQTQWGNRREVTVMEKTQGDKLKGENPKRVNHREKCR